MGQVLIRNLDDATIAAYRAAAARSGRSLEAELRDVLTRMKPRLPDEIERLRELSRQLRAMTPAGVRQTPAEILVREDRDGYRDA